METYVYCTTAVAYTSERPESLHQQPSYLKLTNTTSSIIHTLLPKPKTYYFTCQTYNQLWRFYLSHTLQTLCPLSHTPPSQNTHQNPILPPLICVSTILLWTLPFHILAQKLGLYYQPKPVSRAWTNVNQNFHYKILQTMKTGWFSIRMRYL